MAEKKEEKESWGKFFLDILIIWGILFGVYMLLFHFVLSNDTVSGPSMQPTFQNGDRLIAERHAQIKRGEVVIVKAPDEPGALYIKRVIGLPGEKIVSKNNQIVLTGNFNNFQQNLFAIYRAGWIVRVYNHNTARSGGDFTTDII